MRKIKITDEYIRQIYSPRNPNLLAQKKQAGSKYTPCFKNHLNAL